MRLAYSEVTSVQNSVRASASVRQISTELSGDADNISMHRLTQKKTLLTETEYCSFSTRDCHIWHFSELALYYFSEAFC